jgi:endoglucanase
MSFFFRICSRARVRGCLNRHKIIVAAISLAALVTMATPRVCHAVIRWTGVNLSGAEFGNIPTPGNLGTYGTNYTYPNVNEVNYFKGKGMNVFRLPFRWERMQHNQFDALDATELSRMDTFVTAATAAGTTVIIDPHNFQRYYPDPNNFQQSTQGLVGGAVPNSALVDFWTKLADHYKNNGRVIFNLMNEPTTLPTEQLVNTTNQVIAGIRSTGATNILHVPGNAYTGAWAWNQNWYGTANATAMLNVVDPAQNMVFEAHQYFDYNGSGSIDANSAHAQIGNDNNANNTNIGVERLTDFTNWLETNHLRGFLGEFALPNDRFGTGSKTTGSTVNRPRVADETLQAMMNYMNLHAGVWEGWDWWGGGPWWNQSSYMFGLEPTGNNVINPSPSAEAAALPYLQPFMVHAFTQLAGDFNQDDVVDAKDLILLNMSYGRSGFHLAADGNNDGTVDGADLLLWQQTVGLDSNAPPSSAVAEPTSGALLLIAVVAFGRCRREFSRRG